MIGYARFADSDYVTKGAYVELTYNGKRRFGTIVEVTEYWVRMLQADGQYRTFSFSKMQDVNPVMSSVN